jgi:ATP phosphoribosyltransferase regulatory subunit HisZ
MNKAYLAASTLHDEIDGTLGLFPNFTLPVALNCSVHYKILLLKGAISP